MRKGTAIQQPPGFLTPEGIRVGQLNNTDPAYVRILQDRHNAESKADSDRSIAQQRLREALEKRAKAPAPKAPEPAALRRSNSVTIPSRQPQAQPSDSTVLTPAHASPTSPVTEGKRGSDTALKNEVAALRNQNAVLAKLVAAVLGRHGLPDEVALFREWFPTVPVLPDPRRASPPSGSASSSSSAAAAPASAAASALSLTASDTPASAKKRAATEDLEGHLHKRLRGDGSPIDTPSADSGSNSSDSKEEKKEDSSSA